MFPFPSALFWPLVGQLCAHFPCKLQRREPRQSERGVMAGKIVIASVQFLLLALPAFPLTSQLILRGLTVCAHAGRFRAPPLEGEKVLASQQLDLHHWAEQHRRNATGHRRAPVATSSIQHLLLSTPNYKLQEGRDHFCFH